METQLQLKDRMTVAVMDLEKAIKKSYWYSKDDLLEVKDQVEKIKMLITEMKWED